MTRLFVLLTVISCCNAQILGVGAKIGARLTDDITGFAASESKRYNVGPSVELRLPRRFAVEFDALYSRFGYRTANSDILGGSYSETARANTWEFPMLAKYRPGLPYVLAGYSPRLTSGRFHSTGFNVGVAGGRYDFSGDSDYRVTHGLVLGGGIEFGRGRLRLSPEARYVRWNADRVGIFGSRGFYIAGPQNEVKLLLGITLR
jgi:hypothetical protein